jgi:hypothetical protein
MVVDRERSADSVSDFHAIFSSRSEGSNASFYVIIVIMLYSDGNWAQLSVYSQCIQRILMMISNGTILFTD